MFCMFLNTRAYFRTYACMYIHICMCKHIRLNELANSLAKLASTHKNQFVTINYRDWFSTINTLKTCHWKDMWQKRVPIRIDDLCVRASVEMRLLVESTPASDASNFFFMFFFFDSYWNQRNVLGYCNIHDVLYAKVL